MNLFSLAFNLKLSKTIVTYYCNHEDHVELVEIWHCWDPSAHLFLFRCFDFASTGLEKQH